MKRGDTFEAPDFGTYIEVLRVAKDKTWADIEVTPMGFGRAYPLDDAPEWTI